MTTAQEPRQEQFSTPYRSGDRGAFAGRIVGNHTLVLLELAPGDITLVLILEQHIPFRLRRRKPRLTCGMRQKVGVTDTVIASCKQLHSCRDFRSGWTL